MSAISVELQNVSKRYSGVQALCGVSLTFEAGEIHSLVGENGAGKSTLVKILAGSVRPSEGQLLVDGHTRTLASPRDAQKVGIAYVSQELSLLPKRTVMENILTARTPAVAGFISKSRSRQRVDELMRASGLHLDGDRVVERLNLAEQTFVEILRALARDARLIILDEPTTAMTSDQSALILTLARRLADNGLAVVIVSHALEDVLAISDRISILRDGQLIESRSAEGTFVHELITSMIGRELTELYPEKSLAEHTPVVLSAAGVTRAEKVRDVSFELHAGEILGIGGLVGSGRSELLRCIAGADRMDRGVIHYGGRRIERPHPRMMKDIGLVMVPEDRKKQGLLLEQSIERNVVLPYLTRISRLAFVDRRKEQNTATRAVADFRVKAKSIQTPVKELSGGNQQRVLFAKWLSGSPRVLIVDEPTRGVDVAGKRAIYDFICDFAGAGGAVIVVSSELPELLGLSHRVLVMSRGCIVQELAGDQMTELNVTRAAFGDVLEEKQ